MSEISFTSNIRPVTQKAFNELSTKIGSKNAVGYPWTLNETVKNTSAYTTNICDCTMLGITDGLQVLMMHICPETNILDNRFSEFILKNMNINNPNIQGILIGSQPTPKSRTVYSFLKDILKKFKIPFSELKTSRYPIHSAYSSQKDEWVVTSREIDDFIRQNSNTPERILKVSFDKLKISDLDEIV